MTAQIDDIFRYRDSEYSLCGISDGELFDMSVLDLTPMASCTACWRGYQAFFGIVDSHLVLDGLHVSLFLPPKGQERWVREQGPVINGITPTAPQPDEHDFFNNYYEGLNYHLEYSGGVLIAENFIRDLYLHMGFHPAWKYETVIELIFDRGVLQKENDRSVQMAQLRAKLIQSSRRSPSDEMPSNEQIRQFVERAFDRRYRL